MCAESRKIITSVKWSGNTFYIRILDFQTSMASQRSPTHRMLASYPLYYLYVRGAVYFLHNEIKMHSSASLFYSNQLSSPQRYLIISCISQLVDIKARFYV